MPDPKVYSTEAIAYATIQLVQSILAELVERKLLTEEHVERLFARAVASQGASPMRGNQEAAALLADMARERGRKFR